MTTVIALVVGMVLGASAMMIALVVLSDMTEEKKNGNGKDRSRFF